MSPLNSIVTDLLDFSVLSEKQAILMEGRDQSTNQSGNYLLLSNEMIHSVDSSSCST